MHPQNIREHRAYQVAAALYSCYINLFPSSCDRDEKSGLSGIHGYYEPEQLVGKTCVAITNLPARMMMGIPSEGMLISAVYEYDGHEGLNLLMLDDAIPAGAKLY